MQWPGTEKFEKLKDWEQAWLNAMAKWVNRARPKQLMPHIQPGLLKDDWTKWFLCGGRGSGKTDAGCNNLFWLAFEPETRWFAAAPTASDLKKVVFGGASGLLSVIPDICFYGGSADKGYNKTDQIITLRNGSIIEGHSAETPSRARGPQYHGGLAEELAGWNDGRERTEDGQDKAVYMMDMLTFGTRLGNRTRIIYTSTPKPTELIKQIYYDPEVVLSTFTTFENKENLAESYFKSLLKYEGTRLGRQELYAELLEDEEGEIFSRKNFILWSHKNKLPDFDYIIQSYDTAFTEKTVNDRTACTTWGVFIHPRKGGSYVMLLDAWAEHLRYPDLRPKVVEEYHSCVFGPKEKTVDIVLIEEKGSGISLIQDLQKTGIPIMPYNPGNDSKLERANLVSYLPVHSKIYIPEGKSEVEESGEITGTQKPTSWANEFLTELCQFTGKQKARDDYVDSFSQAMKFLIEQGFLGVRTGYEEPEYPEYETVKEFGNPYAA